MGLYEYEATSPTGKPERGRLQAADDAAAREELGARGLTEVRVWPYAADGPHGELAEGQLTTLVEAVGAAAASRVPLEVTLSALADEKGDRRLSSVARRLAARLGEGATIDEAIADMEHQLPADVRGLLRAGVESGDLAGTFERFAEQRLALGRIDRQIRAAVAYPLLILVVLVPLLLFLSMYVIPMFAELYEDFDVELPPLTILIVHTAEQIPGLVGGLVLLVVAVPIVLRLVGGRWLYHRVRTATPLVGPLWIYASQREFATLLASLLARRLPLASAVGYTGEVMSDRNVARACRRVKQRLESGMPLSQCLGQSIHFDRSLVALAAWGERGGLLPEALRIATDVFDDKVEQTAALVRRILPPLTLVTVTVIMFFVVIGLFVPMVMLVEGLSG